jgi:hypothetical protein
MQACASPGFSWCLCGLVVIRAFGLLTLPFHLGRTQTPQHRGLRHPSRKVRVLIAVNPCRSEARSRLRSLSRRLARGARERHLAAPGVGVDGSHVAQGEVAINRPDDRFLPGVLDFQHPPWDLADVAFLKACHPHEMLREADLQRRVPVNGDGKPNDAAGFPVDVVAPPYAMEDPTVPFNERASSLPESTFIGRFPIPYHWERALAGPPRRPGRPQWLRERWPLAPPWSPPASHSQESPAPQPSSHLPQLHERRL